MEKRGIMEEGVTPCLYCERPSVEFEDRQPVCSQCAGGRHDRSIKSAAIDLGDTLGKGDSGASEPRKPRNGCNQ